MQVLDNFESSYSKFLDARQSWDSLEALQANTDILMPNGFKVFCKEEAKWYILTATDEADPSTYTWNEDGGTDEEAISLASTAITMVSEVDEKAEEALATAATAIAAIDNIGSDETKLDKVSEIPTEPSDNDTILYIGETTENYTKGHIYQYSNDEWKDLTGSDKSKLDKVSKMPNDASFGDTVLYIGKTNEYYTKGHIYSKDTHYWKDITPTIVSKIIPSSNSSELLIYNGDGYKYTEYDVNDDDNPKSLNLYQLKDENYFITPDTSVQYELYGWYNGSQTAFTKNRYPSSNETLYNYDGTVSTEYNFVRYDSENDNLYIRGTYDEFSLSYAGFQNVRRKYYERNDKVYVPGHIYRMTELKGYENYDLNKTYYITSNEAAVGDLLYDENGVFTGKTVEQVNESTITVDGNVYRFNTRFNTYVDTQEQSFVFDDVPTENSKNFINSGAVYNSITEVNEKAEEALATAATAIAAINNIGSDNTKLDKVSEIPVEPSDIDTVLYVGETTKNYTKGHIYQYSEIDTEWKDLTSAGFSIENLAPAFDETVSYNVDTIVTYNDELYICTAKHSAGEWNSENFTKTTVSELLSNINENFVIDAENVIKNTSLADNNTCKAFCVFNNALYVGTSNRTVSLNGIYKSSDGETFTQVATFNGINSLCVFNNVLYAGTVYGIYKSSDGETFTKITSYQINLFCVFNNVLYAGTAYGIYKSSDGETFTKKEFANFVNEYNTEAVSGMCVFNNTLYISFGSNGMYKTSDGEIFDKITSLSSLSSSVVYFSKLYVFNNNLYIGTGGSYGVASDKIYKSNDGITFIKLESYPKSMGVKDFTTYNNTLYIASDTGKVYKTVDTVIELDTALKNITVTSFCNNFNDKLYIGTTKGIYTLTVNSSEFVEKLDRRYQKNQIGELSELTTRDKTNIVFSINETNEKAEEALATAATAIAAANSSSSSLTENITPNVEVGGIGVGDTLTTGQQMTDILKKLLVKYFEPVITLSADKALINKKGATIEAPITITATAEKKSDDVIFYSINYDGNDVSTGNNPDGGEITYIHQTDISADTIFIGSISDGKSTVNKTIKFEFINPYYYGSVNDNEISDFTGLTEEIVKKNINKKVNYTASAEYLVFAYDATYGDLTSIKDKNNFENLPAFTKTVMEVNGENYNVYISSDKITCSNFEYTFKI